MLYSTCRVIRLSSPNLSYILIFGVTLVYLGGAVFLIPSNDPLVLPGLCIVRCIKFQLFKLCLMGCAPLAFYARFELG